MYRIEYSDEHKPTYTDDLAEAIETARSVLRQRPGVEARVVDYRGQLVWLSSVKATV